MSFYDDLFTAVPNAETGGLLNPNDFDAGSWRRRRLIVGS
jgi:hypothetical protein